MKQFKWKTYDIQDWYETKRLITKNINFIRSKNQHYANDLSRLFSTISSISDERFKIICRLQKRNSIKDTISLDEYDVKICELGKVFEQYLIQAKLS
jgi:hypothetical protein